MKNSTFWLSAFLLLFCIGLLLNQTSDASLYRLSMDFFERVFQHNSAKEMFSLDEAEYIAVFENENPEVFV